MSPRKTTGKPTPSRAAGAKAVTSRRKAAKPAGKPALADAARTSTAAEAHDVFAAFTQEQMGRASTALFHGYDQLAAVHKTQIDAFMQSGEAMARGAEEISRLWLGLGQDSLRDAEAAARGLAAAHTVEELVAAQTELARSLLDRMLAESARISELSARVANAAMSPLQAMFRGAFDRLPAPLAWRPAA